MSWTEIVLLAMLAFAAIMNSSGWMTANKWRRLYYQADKRADDLLVKYDRLATDRLYEAIGVKSTQQSDDWPDQIDA